jgi:hypothetical protein
MATPKEDSGHAIYLLISASSSRMRKGFETHFLPWAKTRTFSEYQPNTTDPLAQSMRARKVMNPFAAEFFGCAVLRRLGIQTPQEQVICTAVQARALPDDFIVKVAQKEGTGRTLTWNSTGTPSTWCLASRRVPHAATLDFVSRTIIPSLSARAQFLQTCARAYQTFEELTAQAIGKTCVPADRFFGDFRPTESEIERIKQAMKIDGLQYLRIAAARVFLGCSCPHFSNLLTTTDGRLISLDHARSYFESGEDLRELFYFIDRRSEAFKALDDVARLTESDIRESVFEIPSHPACSFDGRLADYFCQRLKLWKQYAEKEICRSPEMEIDPHLLCSPLGLFGQTLIEEYTPSWRL